MGVLNRSVGLFHSRVSSASWFSRGVSAWLVRPQLCRLSPPQTSSSWSLQVVAKVRFGEIVASGCTPAAHLMSIWTRLQIWREKKKRGDKERERVHERLVWWHLCHSALSRTSFSSSSHSCLSSCCLFCPCHSSSDFAACLLLPALHSLYDLIRSLYPNKLIFKHSPLSHLSSIASIQF